MFICSRIQRVIDYLMLDLKPGKASLGSSAGCGEPWRRCEEAIGLGCGDSASSPQPFE